MAEGGWGGSSGGGQDSIRHPSSGVGYMTHPPPPYQVFPVPNYPPPPINGYMPPMPYNDMYANNAVVRGNWVYANNYVVPNRTPHVDKNYSNTNADIPVYNHVVNTDTNYNVNVENSVPQSDGRRTNFAQENNSTITGSDLVNDNSVMNGAFNRGRGVPRGRSSGGGGGRGRRGGRRRPYGGDRGGGGGGGSSYVSRQNSGDFYGPVDSDEQKRAGRDSALAETAAFMRNLTLATTATSENASAPSYEDVDNANTNRMRGSANRRRMGGRGRGGSWGQQRDYNVEDKQGKEWKNRQMRTESYNGNPVNNFTKTVKERNTVGPEKRLWGDVNSKNNLKTDEDNTGSEPE